LHRLFTMFFDTSSKRYVIYFKRHAKPYIIILMNYFQIYHHVLCSAIWRAQLMHLNTLIFRSGMRQISFTRSQPLTYTFAHLYTPTFSQHNQVHPLLDEKEHGNYWKDSIVAEVLRQTWNSSRVFVAVTKFSWRPDDLGRRFGRRMPCVLASLEASWIVCRWCRCTIQPDRWRATAAKHGTRNEMQDEIMQLCTTSDQHWKKVNLFLDALKVIYVYDNKFIR